MPSVFQGLVPTYAQKLAKRGGCGCAHRQAAAEQSGQSAGATATLTLSVSAQAGAAPPPSSSPGATSGSVGNVMNGQTAAGDTIDIAAYLKQFCASGTSCSEAAQTASQAFDKLGPTAATAAQLMGSGNTAASAGVAAPLIAGALGGAIGGPAGAAVAAAVVTGAESIFSALFGSPPPRVTVSCDYRVGYTYDGGGGYVCFHSPDRPPGPTDPNTGQPDSRWLTMEEFQAGNSAKLGKQTVSWQLVDSNDQLMGQYNSGDIYEDNPGPYGQNTWASVAFGSFWAGVGNPTGTNPSMPSWQASWNAGFLGTMFALGVKLPGVPDSVLNKDPSTICSTCSQNAVRIYNRPAALIDPDAFRLMCTKYLGLPPSTVVMDTLQLTMEAAIGGTQSLTPSARTAMNNVAGFIKVYCQAFYRGICERFINNWQVDANFPMVLMEATVQAWNAAHEGTVQYTFSPNNSVASFVDAVIQNFVVLPGQTQAQGGWEQTINVGPAKATLQAAASSKLGINLSPLTFKAPVAMASNLSVSRMNASTPMALESAIQAGVAQAAKVKATKELAVTSVGVGAFAAFVAGMPWVALGVLSAGALAAGYEMLKGSSSAAAAPMGAKEPTKPIVLAPPNYNAALLKAAKSWPVGSPSYNRLMAAAAAWAGK